MKNTNDFTLRSMQIADYEQIYDLWMTIDGFGIRSIDDSKEGVARFLKRNPSTSVVAEADGHIVGAILCGHDGRRGCLYHVCVHRDYRKPECVSATMAGFPNTSPIMRFALFLPTPGSFSSSSNESGTFP